MRSFRVSAAALFLGAVTLVGTAPGVDALAITVPSTSDLGTVASGTTTRSASLGTVTATDTGVLFVLLPSFTASVSSSNLTTGGATSAETIPKANISYWSGPATATTGSQNPVPGQANAAAAVSLSAPRTAFSSSGLVLTITTSWKPTIIITIPAAAVAGTYTGTITHSVA